MRTRASSHRNIRTAMLNLASAAVLVGGAMTLSPSAGADSPAGRPTGCPPGAVALPDPQGGPVDCAKCPSGMTTTVMTPPRKGITCEEPDQRVKREPPGVSLGRQGD